MVCRDDEGQRSEDGEGDDVPMVSLVASTGVICRWQVIG